MVPSADVIMLPHIIPGDYISSTMYESCWLHIQIVLCSWFVSTIDDGSDGQRSNLSFFLAEIQMCGFSSIVGSYLKMIFLDFPFPCFWFIVLLFSFFFVMFFLFYYHTSCTIWLDDSCFIYGILITHNLHLYFFH